MTTLGNISTPSNQPNLYPITAVSGTSVNYGSLVSESFTLFQQMIGVIFNRSNAGVAMTDTLPVPNQAIGDGPSLPNGWAIKINNVDASASITVTPTLPATIDGTTSLTITAGEFATIYTNGVNYFTELANSGSSGGTGNVNGPASSTNTAVALFNGTTGKVIQNSAVTVSGTGVINTTGNEIDFSGSSVLKTLLTADTFVGKNAGNATMTGDSNLLAGSSAGHAITSGANNTLLGTNAGSAITTASNVVALGISAGANNTASNSVFIGTSAGASNTGLGNTFVGDNAGLGNTSGEFNAFFGTQSGAGNTSGIINTAFGYQSLQSNLTGANNAAFGYKALNAITVGDSSAFGASALQSVTTGGSNSAFGYTALGDVTTGNTNCGFGLLAGESVTTGSDNILIGRNADVSTGAISGAIVIGAAAEATASNQFALGSSAVPLTTQTTVGAAGGASALPATPTGYLQINLNSTLLVIPYYAHA